MAINFARLVAALCSASAAWLFSHAAHAADDPVQDARKAYAERLSIEVDKVHLDKIAKFNTKYLQAVEKERKAAMEAGDLDGTLELKGELDAILDGTPVEEKASTERLIRLRELYDKGKAELDQERVASRRSLAADFAKQMADLEITLTKKSDIEGALAARMFAKELDDPATIIAIESQPPGPVRRTHAGMWAEPVWERMPPDLRTARKRGGKLKIKGPLRRWPSPDLGQAEAYDDFVKVNAYGDVWFARRAGGESYVGSSQGVVKLPPGAILNSLTDRWPGMTGTGATLSQNGRTTNLAVDLDEITHCWIYASMAMAVDSKGTIAIATNSEGRIPPDEAAFLANNRAAAMSWDRVLGIHEDGVIREMWKSYDGGGVIPLKTPIPDPLRIAALRDFYVLSGNGAVYAVGRAGKVTRVPVSPQPVDLIFGSGAAAIQNADGTWQALSTQDPLDKQIRDLGVALDLQIHREKKGAEPFFIWIEPVK